MPDWLLRTLLFILSFCFFFFFNDTATTEIYTLSLHDALPISDYQWFRHALMEIWEDTRPDMVAIIRCTSPFLKPTTIAQAVKLLESDKKADSVRAVRRVREHPGKMWIAHGFRMLPLMPYRLNDTPWHSNQTGELPEVYVQTAGLEGVRTEAVWQTTTISGDAVIPFILDGDEALDINTPEDWAIAELIVKARER